MADKTLNLPSRMLMLRLASCRVVLWALTTHGPRLVENLSDSPSRKLPGGTSLLIEPLLRTLVGLLEQARDRLIASDRDHRDQMAKASAHRSLRNKAFDTLRPYVVGLRDAFKGIYGPETVEQMGFAARTPQQPGVLFEQAEHLAVRLGDPELVLPESRFKGVDLKPAVRAEEMSPLVTRLGQRLEEVSREERRADATKIAKDEAQADYDRTFVWGARVAEDLFRMADLPEVAKRVRPSTRRPGLTVEAETGELDPESGEPVDAGGDDAPEASEPQASDDGNVEA